MFSLNDDADDDSDDRTEQEITKQTEIESNELEE